MTDWIKDHSWVLAPAFIVMLGVIIWLKTRFAGKVEIKPVDVGIALIPFILWMATAGIFKKVEVPGILTFETGDAIVAAAAAPIEMQVSKMPVTALKTDAKEGVDRIPQMIESGTQVLSFQLGYGGYYGPAIWMYFNYLLTSPSFKYVVINDSNGALFGLYEAARLVAVLNPDNNDELLKEFPLRPFRGVPGEQHVSKWTAFSTAIIRSEKDRFRKYPGFVSAAQAVRPDADKKRVLEQMEKEGHDWLPVVVPVNGIDKYQGVVDRSRLTASLILDVATQLEARKQEQPQR